MKRTGAMAAVLALVLVLGVGAVAAAQGPGPTPPAEIPPAPALGSGPFGPGPAAPGSVPAPFQNRSRNFVDQDGDGICDHLGLAPGPGEAPGWRLGRRAHLGRNGGPQVMHRPQGLGAGHGTFVDEDGDGICDNFVDQDGDGIHDLAPRDGTGHQYGRGMGRWNR